MPTPSTDDLIDIAQSVTGRPVLWHRGGPKGDWDGQQISVRHGMSDTQTRSTIAHELVHAWRGDPCGHCPTNEHRADRLAARLLITPGAYAHAEAVYDGDLAKIADDLGVTTHLLAVWREAYEREMT